MIRCLSPTNEVVAGLAAERDCNVLEAATGCCGVALGWDGATDEDSTDIGTAAAGCDFFGKRGICTSDCCNFVVEGRWDGAGALREVGMSCDGQLVFFGCCGIGVYVDAVGASCVLGKWGYPRSSSIEFDGALREAGLYCDGQLVCCGGGCAVG